MSTDTLALIWISLLSFVLIVLLVCLIVVVFQAIKVMASVRRIADKAERTTDQIADAADRMTHGVGPVALNSAVTAILQHWGGRKQRDGKEDK